MARGARNATYRWQFKSRFRRGAFGWRPQPAITRVKEAVSEIRKVARKDPVLAAEGAVTFLERVSPALEQVDSPSGAIGTAVHRAIDALVPVIAAAPVDVAPREILAALVETTPGDAGKWFAAAKEAGLFDEALALARRTPCDPRTLARAARDFVKERPEFALEAGFLSLYGMVQGHGFDLTGHDVLAACRPAMAAAGMLGREIDLKAGVSDLIARGGPNARWVRDVLGKAIE